MLKIHYNMEDGLVSRVTLLINLMPSAVISHHQAIYRTAHMEPDICIWAWVRNISGPKEADAALNLYLLKAEDNPDTSVSRSTLKPGIVSSKYLVSCPCPKKKLFSLRVNCGLGRWPHNICTCYPTYDDWFRLI